MSARVFRAIWQRPHISRVEIARYLQVEKSTITTEVSSLLKKGIIEETMEGDASPRGGRRPIHLGVRSEAGHLIGIDLQSNSYTAISVDLLGNVLAKHSDRIEINRDGFEKTALRVIKDSVRKLKRDTDLLGVGLGMSGLISSKCNTIRFSPALGVAETFDFALKVASRLLLSLLH